MPRTLRRVDVNKVRLGSEHDLLQDDSEAVDVSFLSSVDRSSCHTQQLRCCPQLITVILILVRLHQSKRFIIIITASFY